MSEPKKDSKLTLVDRAFALPNSEKEFGMKIADHKLICKVLDDHLDSILDKVDDKILRTLQSEELADRIVEKVRANVAETYTQLAAVLLNIQEGQKVIAKDIYDIKERLRETEKNVRLEEERLADHEKRLADKKRRIEKLEIQMACFQPGSLEEIREFTHEFEEVKPYIIRWGKVFNWWELKNWWKIALIFVALLGLFFGLIWFSHKINWVSQDDYKVSYELKDIKSRIRAGELSKITRGFYLPMLTNYTKKQTDSVSDDFHDQNILSIQKSIDERNRIYEEKYGKKSSQ